MKIAVWHNLPSGGGKRALYHQVEGLLARGHTVEAWCPSHADPHYLPLSQLVSEHVLPCPPMDWQVPQPSGRLARLIRRYWRSNHDIGIMLAHGQASAAAIAQGQFDVLLAHPCMFLRVPTIGRFLDLPKVLYLQEPDRKLYEADPHLPWPALDLPVGFWHSARQLKRWGQDAARVQALRGRARAELTSVRAFDRVLVNSLFSRESLQRAYGLGATLSYLGVDAERFQPTGAARERLVVSLGALHPTKRVDLAVRAVAAIPADRRPELVWMANFADPGYRQQVEQLAQASGVRFTALVGIEDALVVDWLSRAAVMVYTPRLEPFGFAPLEANACETPVVAVAEGGVRETITHDVNGLLVDGDEPERLGAALLQVLDDPALARRLGEAGRRVVLEKWLWPRSIERLEQQLAEVVALRRPKH